MILVIDNYDSFTYNLVQYLGELGQKLEILRNDQITVGKALGLGPDKILISPGPGRPPGAGITKSLIRKASDEGIPVLGVCLGHQAIAEVFGGKIVQSPVIMHGKTSAIYHDNKGIFEEINNPFKATRYHSLTVDRGTLPKDLKIIAWTKDKEIMGLRHKKYSVWGVQFHPESILTEHGKSILRNFIKIKR